MTTHERIEFLENFESFIRSNSPHGWDLPPASKMSMFLKTELDKYARRDTQNPNIFTEIYSTLYATFELSEGFFYCSHDTHFHTSFFTLYTCPSTSLAEMVEILARAKKKYLPQSAA